MNTKTVPYVIKTNGAVTMYLDGESVTVAQDHPNYNLIVDSLKTGRCEKLSSLVHLSRAVEEYAAKATDRVRVQNGVVTYDGTPIHNTLTTRIIKMMAEGYKFDHMLRFFENLMQNPSKRSVQELYTFLENYGLPITEDGHFLAYKAVKSDYYDIYTGRTHLNTIGSVQKMVRNQVDDNWGKDCSEGLHVGALDYVVGYGHFVKGQLVPVGGNRLLICKVNPADVVSVPSYEKFTKMRVCQYTVVDEIKNVVQELDKIVYKADVDTGVTETADEDPVDLDEDVSETNDKATRDLLRTKFNPETDDADQYLAGFDDGESDQCGGWAYGYSRDTEAGDSYRKGYNDGYNQRECQVTPNYDESDTDENDDDCGCCSCGGCRSDEEVEYNRGYDAALYDLEEGHGYQTSIDLDSSDDFYRGYTDGWNDHRN